MLSFFLFVSTRISSIQTSTSMKYSENVLEIELSAKEFIQQIANDSVEILRQFREFQNRVRYAKNITLSFFVLFIWSSLIFVILNQQFMILIAQIVTQTIQNQSSSSYLAFIINLSLTSIVISITFFCFSIRETFEYIWVREWQKTLECVKVKSRTAHEC